MSKKTTFKELIGEISDQTNKSQAFTEHFIRELVGIIEDGLESSGSVTLAGFGKFELRWMDERSGVNPQTGEEITIPGQNKVVFKPYKALREHVNKPYAQMQTQLLDERPAPPADPGSGSKTGEASDKEDSMAGFHSEKSSVKEDPFQLEMEQNEEDDIDKWVYERPSPVQQQTGKNGNQHNSPSRESAPAKPGGPGQEGQAGNGRSFGWSLAAIAAVLLIAFLALFIVLKPGQDLNEPTAESPPAITEPETADRIEQQEPISEPAEPQTEYIPIEIEDGQSLWGLADNHLGNAYLWPWIYHVNRAQLTNPNIILAGNDLTLPIPSNTDQLTEDERMGVASGYLDIYSWYRDTDPDNAKYYLWAAGTFHEEVLEEAAESVNYNDLVFARNR